MRKIISIDRFGLNICSQKLRYKFFFQIDWSKKYILYRLFQFKFDAGISTCHHIEYSTEPFLETWIERDTVGLFFDTTVLNIRLGIYFHPIVYKTRR